MIFHSFILGFNLAFHCIVLLHNLLFVIDINICVVRFDGLRVLSVCDIHSHLMYLVKDLSSVDNVHTFENAL